MSEQENIKNLVDVQLYKHFKLVSKNRPAIHVHVAESKCNTWLTCSSRNKNVDLHVVSTFCYYY